MAVLEESAVYRLMKWASEHPAEFMDIARKIKKKYAKVFVELAKI